MNSATGIQCFYRREMCSCRRENATVMKYFEKQQKLMFVTAIDFDKKTKLSKHVRALFCSQSEWSLTLYYHIYSMGQSIPYCQGSMQMRVLHSKDAIGQPKQTTSYCHAPPWSHPEVQTYQDDQMSKLQWIMYISLTYMNFAARSSRPDSESGSVRKNNTE